MLVPSHGAHANAVRIRIACSRATHRQINRFLHNDPIPSNQTLVRLSRSRRGVICTHGSPELQSVRSTRCFHSSTRLDNASQDAPMDRYDELVAQGTLNRDDYQVKIVSKLQTLHERLRGYNPPPIEPPTTTQSFFGRLFARKPLTSTHIEPIDIPQGLYLYGDVGTGKTMLMDIFYETLPSNIRRKRRAHFHAFMIDVHKRIHAVKAASGAMTDPIHPIARELANEAIVFCFDEFQVTDIADAMILRRLMESLLEFGVVFVMTSNRHPDDLYKNGIQRESFVPCIELIKERLDVTDLDSGTDYRRILKTLSNVYYSPLDHANREEIDKLFKAVADGEHVVHGRKLTVWGRPVVIPQSTSKVAKFTFQDLCGKPLSASDYLEITKTFPSIFVVDIPHMSFSQKDLARRFITFIDACYETKTKLFLSSEVPIFHIFSDDRASGQVSDHVRSVMDDLGLSDTNVGASSLFSGDEEVFAFARAVSRLVQMGTKQWAETAGQP